MIELLGKYQSQMKRKGVIHSFTSGLELAQKELDKVAKLKRHKGTGSKQTSAIRQLMTLGKSLYLHREKKPAAL